MPAVPCGGEASSQPLRADPGGPALGRLDRPAGAGRAQAVLRQSRLRAADLHRAPAGRRRPLGAPDAAARQAPHHRRRGPRRFRRRPAQPGPRHPGLAQHAVRFVLLPGQRHDSAGVAPLLTNLDFSALLADKAFDSDAIRADLDDRGAAAVIPPKANRVTTIPCDFEMYKWRHLVENFFCKIKEFRRIATRYDKTDTSFSAMIQLVGSVLATR